MVGELLKKKRMFSGQEKVRIVSQEETSLEMFSKQNTDELSS